MRKTPSVGLKRVYRQRMTTRAKRIAIILAGLAVLAVGGLSEVRAGADTVVRTLTGSFGDAVLTGPVAITGTIEDVASAPAPTPASRGWRYPHADRAGTGSDDTSYAATTDPLRAVWSIDMADTHVGLRSGDVTGDGLLDLVVFSAREVRVLGADGRLQSGIALPVDAGSVVLEDIDGDSVNEILVGSRNTTELQINIFSGDGTLLQRVLGRSGDPGDRASLVFDPIAFLRDGRLATLYSTGSAARPRGYAVFDLNAGINGKELFYYDLGPQPYAVSVADLNGDGTLDMLASVVSAQDGAIGTGIDGMGTRTTDADLYTVVVDEHGREVLVQLLGEDTRGGARGRGYQIITSIDGQGEAEIIAAVAHFAPEFPGDAQIRVLNTDGSLRRRVSVGPDAAPQFLVADLEGDAIKEVVVTTADRALNIYAADLSLKQRTADAGRELFAAADVDGNGVKEILAANANVLKVFDGSNLAEKTQLPLEGDLTAAITADIDGDAMAEIAVATAAGKVFLLTAAPLQPGSSETAPFGVKSGAFSSPAVVIGIALVLLIRLVRVRQ